MKLTVTAGRRAALAVVLSSGSIAAAAVPQPGDYLVASRSVGVIFAVDPATGQVRGSVTGPEFVIPATPPVGTGPGVSSSFNTALAMLPGRSIYARFCTASNWGLLIVDPATGNRAFAHVGPPVPAWNECGEVLALNGRTLLTTADDFQDQFNARGRLLAYDVVSGRTTIISGETRGDGPLFDRVRALALVDCTTALVAEWNLPSAGPAAATAGLFRVDLITGNRTFVSRLSPAPLVRPLAQGGVVIGSVTLGDDEGGSGPVPNIQTRSITVLNGTVYAGCSSQMGASTFYAGIFEIQPDGDRILRIGTAYADDGAASTLVTVPPASGDPAALDSIQGLTPTPAGRIAFVNLFGQERITEWDPATNALVTVSDIRAQFTRSAPAMNFSGLTIFRAAGAVIPQCNPLCPGDADGDGSVGLADIALMITHWSATEPPVPPGTLGDLDGDTLVTLADLAITIQYWGVQCLPP